MKHIIFILFLIFWLITIITAVFNFNYLNSICILACITLILIEVIDRRKIRMWGGLTEEECSDKLYGEKTRETGIDKLFYTNATNKPIIIKQIKGKHISYQIIWSENALYRNNEGRKGKNNKTTINWIN